eukprot:comp11481_c0_seq1/m.5922 comp11481_c0_seq1/g.5922  ORF comp11481_c0_seq1/g.5922 comp11481_c0_seq1/m.5922 type:complete len:202 (-) comp11481_c0_seq1:598-1203(-)
MAPNNFALMTLSLQKLDSKAHIDRLRHTLFINKVYQQAYQAEYKATHEVVMETDEEYDPYSPGQGSAYAQTLCETNNEDTEPLESTCADVILGDAGAWGSLKRGASEGSDSGLEHACKRLRSVSVCKSDLYEDRDDETASCSSDDTDDLSVPETTIISSSAFLSTPQVGGYVVDPLAAQKAPCDFFMPSSIHSQLVAVHMP